jgi:hypothetical protein
MLGVVWRFGMLGMFAMHAIRYLAVLSLCAGIASGAPQAADDPLEHNAEHWRAILKAQLKTEMTCDLNEVLAYQEVPLGDDRGVDGRISCFDGREFNFSRKSATQKFSIELCAAAVC